MANELPIAILVGIPGPAGSGVTSGEWLDMVDKVNRLLTPTANPIVDGAGRTASFVTTATTPTQVTDCTVVVNIDIAKAAIVTAWVSADITHAGSNIAYLSATIGSGTYIGNYYATPTGSGTYAAISGIGRTFGAGQVGATFTVRPILYTSAGVSTSYANLRVWVSVFQPG